MLSSTHATANAFVTGGEATVPTSLTNRNPALPGTAQPASNTAASSGGGTSEYRQYSRQQNRKMARVFTPSGGDRNDPPYGRDRNMAGGPRMNQYPRTRQDFRVSGSGNLPPMYDQRPRGGVTHVRTISGSGNIDEYDCPPFYVERSNRGRPAPFNRYPPPRGMGMRGRGFRNRRNFYDEMPQMSWQPFRRRNMNGEMYRDDEIEYRYGRPPRRSIRRDTGNNNDYYVDGPPERRQQRAPNSGPNGRYPMQKPDNGQRPRRRRRSTRLVSQNVGANSDPSRVNNERPLPQGSAEDASMGRRGRRIRRRRRVTNTASANADTVAAAVKQSVSNDDASRRPSTNGRRYVCSICRQAFRTENMRLRHMRIVHPRRRRRDFVCKECRGVFTNARSITVHQSNPHPEERQPAVDARNATLGTPIRYLSESTPIFGCKFCPFGFLSAPDAESHQGRCRASQQMSVNFKLEYPGNDQYILSCFCCPELLCVRQNMAEHFRILHPFVNFSLTYCCTLCSKEFDSEAGAVKHMESVHASGTDQMQLEALGKKRERDFILESLKSYEVKRPVSVARVMSDVRQVLGRVVRQVVRRAKAADSQSTDNHGGAGVTSAKPIQQQ